VLFGTGVYALLRSAGELKSRKWLPVLKRLGTLALWSIGGAVMALAQLLPTLELSRLSVRSGGLPYQEAASFSLKPGLIFKALLPPLLWPPPFSEYVTYVGFTGLALAAIALWAAWRRRRHQAGQSVGLFLALACVGIFLALGAYNPVYYLLYKLVPGFDLFRAPARWLLFYSLGAAILAGMGLQALPSLARERSGLARQLRSMPVLLAVAALLVLELFAAGRRLAYNQPTAPAAYDSLRSAPSHLLADAQQPDEGAAQVAPSKGAPQQAQDIFRFLSMSDIQYDPGDMGDLQAMYANDLPEESIYHLIVATKMKEVLAYNLPLVYRLFSVDGYDGGLLPIQNYVTLERLFLSEEEIWPDGRLRQQLRTVPPARLLSLLNVKYVVTDKTQDAWIDDAFYDLEHTVPVGLARLNDLPSFGTTHLGLVSYLSGASSVQDGTVVAQVVITGNAAGPVSYTLPLVAGTHTAEGPYGAQPVAHQRARVGHVWHDNESGNDYIARLELPEPMLPTAIRVEGLLPDATLHLRGLTLLDEESGTSRYLSIDPAYKLVHSGDVKVYQNLSVLPRAFAVHQARVVAGEEQALELLRDPALDPAETVILSSGTELNSQGRDDLVRITHYQPEHVQIRVDLEEPGYLVLTDTYYPGWLAELDGQQTPIHRANLYFRAVSVPAGQHQVIFRYQPAGLGLGLTVSLAAWGLWLAATLVALARIGRKHPSHV
jgi:hypothetical protein